MRWYTLIMGLAVLLCWATLLFMRDQRAGIVSPSYYAPTQYKRVCDRGAHRFLGNLVQWECDVYNLDYSIDRPTLVIGNSLSRRFAYTWHALSTNKLEVSDLNYDKVRHKRVDIVPGRLVFVWAPKFEDIVRYLSEPKNTAKFGLIVASAGTHETKVDHASIDALGALASRDPRIWFRTEGLPDQTKSDVYEKVGRYVRETWPTHRLVDTQAMLRGRDIGSARIRGNTPQHFGVDARVAIVQQFLLHYK